MFTSTGIREGASPTVRFASTGSRRPLAVSRTLCDIARGTCCAGPLIDLEEFAAEAKRLSKRYFSLARAPSKPT